MVSEKNYFKTFFYNSRSEEFEKKKRVQKKGNNRVAKKYKWTNGQSELLSRCSVIIRSKGKGKRFHKKNHEPDKIFIK